MSNPLTGKLSSAIVTQTQDTLLKLSRLTRFKQLIFLFFLSTVFNPYMGIVHDAMLYGIQVMHRLNPELWSKDLFFAYGSQDDYSLFSALLAPLAKEFGVSVTFVITFIVLRLIFIAGLMTLMSYLLKDATLYILSLIVLVVSDIPYGGFGVFQVNENFTTARLLALSLSTAALGLSVSKHYVKAFVVTAFALTIHPIMPMAAIIFAVMWWQWERAGPRGVFLFSALLLFLFVLNIGVDSVLGAPIYGHMDHAWQYLIKSRAPFNFINAWPSSDWLRLLVSSLVFVAGLTQQNLKRVSAISLALIVFAITLSLLGAYLNCAVLIQAQPHRLLWLSQILSIPTALRLSKSLFETRRKVVALLLGYVTLRDFSLHPEELLILAVLLGGLFIYNRVLFRGTSQASLDSSLTTLIITPLILLFVTTLWLLNNATSILNEHPMRFLWEYICKSGGSLVLIVIFSSMALKLLRGSFYPRILLATSLVIHLFIATLPHRDLSRYKADIDNERSVAFLKSHIPVSDSPTIYWPLALSTLWFKLGVPSYFDMLQLAGIPFNRTLAMEGMRRIELVKTFELNALKNKRLPSSDWLYSLLWPADGRSKSSPRALITLCNDVVLDYVILPEHFSELRPISDGNIYIYPCDQIRYKQSGKKEG